MTWTGKTNKKDTKKIAFKSFTKITKLLITLSQAADVKYTDAIFAKTIVYKILKYAYRANPSNDDASDVRAIIEAPIIIDEPSTSVASNNENPLICVSTSSRTQLNQQPIALAAAPHLQQVPFSYIHPSNWMNSNVWPQIVMQQTQNKPNVNSK